MSIEALESLLEHPGWKLFQEQAKAEWSPGACWRKVMEQGGNLEKVSYTNEQVGALMTWPAQEVARLKRAAQEPEPSLSRGGYR